MSAQNQPAFSNKSDVDFVIIGAGAAGGVVAKELSTAGFRVLVLEQGPYLQEKDFTHDELKVVTRVGRGPALGRISTFGLTTRTPSKLSKPGRSSE